MGEPAKLSEQDILNMRRHPLNGYRVLKQWGVNGAVAELDLYHHKRKDGYPSDEDLIKLGFDPENVPFLAEIVSVADTFDAITAPRDYQRQGTKEDALKVLNDLKGDRYDERCVEALEDVLEQNTDIVEALQLYSLIEPLGFSSQK